MVCGYKKNNEKRHLRVYMTYLLSVSSLLFLIFPYCSLLVALCSSSKAQGCGVVEFCEHAAGDIRRGKNDRRARWVRYWDNRNVELDETIWTGDIEAEVQIDSG